MLHELPPGLQRMVTMVKYIRVRMISALISADVSVILRAIDDPENGTTALG
jgi:hypothetical protein